MTIDYIEDKIYKITGQVVVENTISTNVRISALITEFRMVKKNSRGSLVVSFHWNKNTDYVLAIRNESLELKVMASTSESEGDCSIFYLVVLSTSYKHRSDNVNNAACRDNLSLSFTLIRLLIWHYNKF